MAAHTKSTCPSTTSSNVHGIIRVLVQTSANSFPLFVFVQDTRTSRPSWRRGPCRNSPSTGKCSSKQVCVLARRRESSYPHIVSACTRTLTPTPALLRNLKCFVYTLARAKAHAPMRARTHPRAHKQANNPASMHTHTHTHTGVKPGPHMGDMIRKLRSLWKESTYTLTADQLIQSLTEGQ